MPTRRRHGSERRSRSGSRRPRHTSPPSGRPAREVGPFLGSMISALAIRPLISNAGANLRRSIAMSQQAESVTGEVTEPGTTELETIGPGTRGPGMRELGKTERGNVTGIVIVTGIVKHVVIAIVTGTATETTGGGAVGREPEAQ